MFMFRSRDLALRRTHFGALAGFGLLGVFGWPGGREVYGASSQELHVLLKAVVRSGRQSGLLRGTERSFAAAAPTTGFWWTVNGGKKP